MKKTFSSILVIVLCCHFTLVKAQNDTTNYTVYDYIKVEPNMQADYLKLEKAFKKIHAAKKKAGKLDGWSLTVVISGSDNSYNYVTRNSFKGSAQLANLYDGQYMPDKWQSLLTPAEVALVNRTATIRTIVKEEVYSVVERVVNDNPKSWKVAVYNYFSSPQGKTVGDHIKMETDIWKPVHAQRVKDGKMQGWLLMVLELPFGASLPYNSMTVDLYSSMNKYLGANTMASDFTKVHAGQDANDLFKQTGDAATLTRGEVRYIIDQLD